MKIYPEYSAEFSLELGLYQNKYALWWSSCTWGIYDLFNEKFLICFISVLYKLDVVQVWEFEALSLTLENEATDLSETLGKCS